MSNAVDPTSSHRRAATRRASRLIAIAAVLALGVVIIPPQARAESREAAPVPADQDPAVSPLTFAPGAVSSGWLAFDYYAGNRIFIPVKVNGREVMAMLDSGASASVLDPAFVAQTGLTAVGEHQGEGVGGSTTYAAVEGVTIEIGDMTWSNGSAVAIDLSGVSRQLGRELQVVLGGEMFTGAVVEIDFVGRRIAFHKPDAYAPPATAVSAPLSTGEDLRSISVMIEGRPAQMLFDIGNAGTATLFPRFWEHPGFIDGRRRSTTYAGGVGGMRELGVTLVDRVEIGGAAFDGMPVRLSTGETAADDRANGLDGNLGMGVLNRFHLTIDFPHDRVLFQPPVDQAPFRVNHVGLTLQPGDTGPRVLHVASGSPAEGAGLRAGDVITGVDGVEAADLSTGPWQSGSIGQRLTLHMADGRTVDLTLARYF